MRILTVCSNYRVFGAETVNLTMLAEFKRRGHENLAVASIWSDGEFSRRLAELGIPEVQMPFGHIPLPRSLKLLKWSGEMILRLPGLWFTWWQVNRKFRPDVIVWTSSRSAALVLPFISKTPSFLIEYTNLTPNKRNIRLYHRLAKKLTGFVGVSAFMGQHLKTLGAPAEKVFVVRSGVYAAADEAEISAATANLSRFNGDKFRVGIVGQISEHKGHDDLVEAVNLLKSQGLKLSVLVYGSGTDDYVQLLKTKIQRYQLEEDWHWMGYENDKLKIFGGMDICVVPSAFGDPFPTTALEASVYGLPVVASRRGGLPEIIEDGVTGWLVESDAPAQLADRIGWLAQHPDQARELGRAGRAKIFREFTVEKSVDAMEDLFRKAGAMQ
jgi:glycosyltransferase involved in cell wall biosynthesis